MKEREQHGDSAESMDQANFFLVGAHGVEVVLNISDDRVEIRIKRLGRDKEVNYEKGSNK